MRVAGGAVDRGTRQDRMFDATDGGALAAHIDVGTATRVANGASARNFALFIPVSEGFGIDIGVAGLKPGFDDLIKLRLGFSTLAMEGMSIANAAQAAVSRA